MAQSLESGTILSRSLAVFLGDLPVLVGLSLLVWSPRLALALALPPSPAGGEVAATTVFGLLATLATAVALAQVQIAVVALRLWRPRDTARGPTLTSDWRRAVPIVLTAAAVAVLTALAFGFFLLPGWIVLAGLFVTLPVLLAEDRSPLGALQRSWSLMEGHKLPVFALVLMFSVVERGFDMIADRLGAPALVGALGAVLVYALQAVAAVITYEDLRGWGPPTPAPAPTGEPGENVS